MNTTQNIYFGLDSSGGRARLTDPTPELNELLVGKSISSVDKDAGILKLSDGTVLTIVPNHGEGYQGEGDFFIHKLCSVEGMIVAVEVSTGHDSTLPPGLTEVYELSVYAAGNTARQLLVSVIGDSGEGYDGSGFTVLVSR